MSCSRMSCHFGSRVLPTRPAKSVGAPEDWEKAQAALRQATRNTKAGEYRKIRDGAKLLATIDPTAVRKHCKWCDRLFSELGKAIGAKI